ncbi:hypothetical protein CPB83DRAFT_879488 [Crepidotus variabilis]|uniref:Uncharacterized protein n=1 Tax=Crepidotus variabilis TaxID=179855 RepID=A0A9P6EQJ5_9AGAR|nr:hypothetical protein CPB83DRAFT_879488 [Crepidotus variabilis]
MENVNLPDDVKYLFEILDKMALATLAELRGRRLQVLNSNALELSRQLQAQCLREDVDSEGVDVEDVEKERDEISQEVDRRKRDQDLILDDFSLYQEHKSSLLDVDWDALQKYSREAVNRMEETRTILLNVTKDDHILLERKREKEEHHKIQRAKIHPVLNDLESLRNRLEKVCKIFRMREVENDASIQTPEQTASSTVPEELSLPSLSTQISIPLEDEALFYRFQQMLAGANSLHEGRTADEFRLSALELEFEKVANEAEQNEELLSPPFPQPKPSSMEDIRPLVKAVVEEQFKATSSLPLLHLKSQVLLSADAVHNELSEKIAEANRLMCKILTSSPNYVEEDGEISSPRISPPINEKPRPTGTIQDTHRAFNHI